MKARKNSAKAADLHMVDVGISFFHFPNRPFKNGKKHSSSHTLHITSPILDSTPTWDGHIKVAIVRTLSHVSTHEYFHVSIHVAFSWLGHVSHLSSLFGCPSRYLGAFCSDHLRYQAALTSLIASNLFWYVRPCPTDTRLTNGTLPILTSTLVGARLEGQQAISWCVAWHSP